MSPAVRPTLLAARPASNLEVAPEFTPAPIEQESPHIRAVPSVAPKTRPGLVHGILALVGLAVIVLCQMGLSIALSNGAYEVRELQAASAQLGRQEQNLQEQLNVLNSPQNLATAATNLGMVGGQEAQFIQLSSGVVLGGPDALHAAGEIAGHGGLLVPNALLAPETAATTTPVVPETEKDPEPYPGMLLPAEGVANEQG
ncbi:hypothetical protein [Humidisolicoccus flavus]|uniref:hypothetical protein n=1 Tax=Humidisolicoccus flavus TaxID=3111414 RepID=UPI0032530F70